jgi:hypothetical protein
MKRLLAMFVLTPREQRLVTFIVVVVVLGLWIKHQPEGQMGIRTDRNTAGQLLVSQSPTPNDYTDANASSDDQTPSFQARNPAVADK